MSQPDSDFEERLDAAFSGEEPADVHDDRLQSALSVLQLIERVRADRDVKPVTNETVVNLGATWPEAASRAPIPKQIGRFHIRRLVGRGGHGAVFLAHDPRLNRDVALKVPLLDAILDPDLRRRFLMEAKAAASLNHTNVVPVFEVGSDGPTVYITSAFCSGPTLAEWAEEQSPIDCQDAATIARDLASAIQHAHDRGVVHRDLKPSNVLIETTFQSSDRITFTPLITDFGMARLESENSDHTRTGTILGTPEYMSPEQSRGKPSDVGPPTDVYSIGAILYFLLVGKPPLSGESVFDTLQKVRSDPPVPPARLRDDVPADLQAICLRCMEKEPPLRYASAEALEQDLAAFLGGRAVSARNLTAFERFRRTCTRNPLVTALIGALTTVLLSVSIVASLTAMNFRELLGEVSSSLERQEELTVEANTSHYYALKDQLTAFRWSHRAGHRTDAQRIVTEAVGLMEDLGREEDREWLRSEFADILNRIDLVALRPEDTPGELDWFEASPDKKTVFRVSPDGRRTPVELPWLNTARPTMLQGWQGRYLRFAYPGGLIRFARPGDETPALTLKLRPREAGYQGAWWWDVTDDGSVVMCGNQIGDIGIWNTNGKGAKTGWFSIMQVGTDYDLAPSGRSLAVSTRDSRQVRVFDSESHEEVVSTGPLPHAPHSVEWTPDEQFIVHAIMNQIEVRDASTLNLVRSTAVRQPILSINLMPNGRTLAVSLGDGSFDLLSWPELNPLVSSPGSPVDFHKNYVRLYDKTALRVVDKRTTTRLRASRALDAAHQVCFSPNGEYLLTANSDGIDLRNGVTGTIVAHYPLEGTCDFCFGDNETVFVGTTQGLFRIPYVKGVFAQRELMVPAEFERVADGFGHKRPGPLIARDGEVFFSSGAKLVQVRDDEVFAQPLPFAAWRLSLSEDRKFLAVCGARTLVLRRDDLSLPFRMADTAHEGGLSQGCVFPPGGHRAIVIREKLAEHYRLPNWQRDGEAMNSDAGIAVARDGTVATYNKVDGIRLWSPTDRELMRLSVTSDQQLVRLALTPDGTRLAVVFFAGDLQIWNLAEIRRELDAVGLDW